VSEIGLAEVFASLRAELSEAVEKGRDQEIQFPVGEVVLEFHIGVTRDVHGAGKLRFWVLELGGSGGYEAVSIQKVTLSLGPPVDPQGRTIKILRRLPDKR
jgi:hypothetical protein